MRYAVAVSAIQRSSTRTSEYMTIGIILATSQDEANGKAIHLMKEQWPIAEGWRDFNVVSLLIPDSPSEVGKHDE